MRRERVSDDIYVFTSDQYAQVTATAVVTTDGIVVIDTLPFSQESRAMASFLTSLGRGSVRYVINTHWHGDHTNGNAIFGSVQLLSHERCAQAMREMVKTQQASNAEGGIRADRGPIRVPDITFDEGDMYLHLGGKSLQMIPTPGHTPDSIVVQVKEDKVLVAADTLMPLPYFVGGSRDEFVRSLEALMELNLDTVVQGHGEVLLRGEVKDIIAGNIKYLHTIQQKVAHLVETGQGPEALRKLDIESCGKSRIPLNGLVQELHYANLQALYAEMTQRNGNGKGQD
jgi:cyclase